MLDMKQQKRISILIWLLLILLSVGGCQNTRVVAELPISFKDNKTDGSVPFLFPVKIGAKEYIFFLDTGATCSQVDYDLKPLLGKFLGSSKPVYSFHKMLLENYEIKKTLKLGKVRMTGKICCLDIEKLVPGSGVDGIIGQDLIKHFVVQIDYQNKLLRLLQESSPDMNIRQGWGVRVPLTIDSHGFICLKLNLGYEVYEDFVLDSGIWGPVYLREEVFENLKNKGQLKEVTLKGYRVIALKEAFVGKCKITRLAFVAQPESELPVPAGLSMLSMHFLSRFKMVTIDLRNKEIYLKPL